MTPATVTVTVCVGTACSVMEGGQLLLLEEHLPERFRGRVRLKGARCLEACHARGCGEAPFVMVEDQPLARASLASVLEALEVLLDGPEAEGRPGMQG